MDRWIETELKLGLPNEAAWRWVREQLGPGAVRDQENHFFDTPERAFRRAQIGVRLRREGEEITLTLKANGDQHEAKAAVSRRIELERAITRSTFDAALIDGLSIDEALFAWQREALETLNTEPIRAVLDRIEGLARGGPLRRFGGFANRREILQFSTQDAEGAFEATLELDRTEYPGGRVDFEIEVELGLQPSPGDGQVSPQRDGSLGRTRRALEDWLIHAGGFEPSVIDSKLARLDALLTARNAGE